MKMHLTEKAIAGLKAVPGKQTLVWDSETKGFGVLVSGGTAKSPGVTKSYVVKHGNQRRVFLPVGAVDAKSGKVIDLPTVKLMAGRLKLDLKDGRDPVKLAAEKKAADEAARAAAETAKIDQRTVREVLADYLQKDDLTEVARANYEQKAAMYLKAWLDRPMVSITAADVDTLRKDIAAGVVARQYHRRTYDSKPGTGAVKAALGLFRSLWRWETSRRMMPMMPSFRLPRLPTRDTVIEDHDLARFHAALMAVPESLAHERDLVLLCLFTGLRLRTASSLEWKEVDFTANLLRLPPEKMKRREAFTLPMSTQVAALLKSRAINGSTLVFPSAHSDSGHLCDADRALEAVADATGIKVALHDLRRTYAGIAESAGVTFGAVAALLHQKVKGVTGGYIHRKTDALREPAQRTADKMSELCGKPGTVIKLAAAAE